MLNFIHLASLAATFTASIVGSVPTGSGGVDPSAFGPTPAPSVTTSTSSTVTTATSSTASSCGSGPAIVAITSGTPVTGYSLAGGGLVSSVYHYPTTFAQFISRIMDSSNCLNVFYFNLHDNGNSYIPTSWDAQRKLTLDWDGSSSVIQTRNHTQWGVQSWFLACEQQGYWTVYLQTGTDTPPGENCCLTQLGATD
ncbi:hypothetical protein M407DRAFT_234834 [Tulasnella calospora MUT 4182]|uniref:Uncharacterized protein n=1 Tax=Tulasnella calospora MUT 4182 TaxID=1051891 RepID=A0A0C3Q9C9_9AGAM|nr:hypothetical protein M407DRAFT_234834 [Tulasnella calospora MUT 4182]